VSEGIVLQAGNGMRIIKRANHTHTHIKERSGTTADQKEEGKKSTAQQNIWQQLEMFLHCMSLLLYNE
jgi:hypothetical protein